MGRLKIKKSLNHTFTFKSLVPSISEKLHWFNRQLYPFLLKFAGVVCIVIFTIWGLKEVWNTLTDLSIFKVNPATLTFNVPPWMDNRFSEDIKQVEALHGHYSLYERDIAHRIATIYGDMVVIKKVDVVKRVFPNKLNIRFTMRRPFALIKKGENSYLVDEEGVLLPKEYYKFSDVDYINPYIQSRRLSRLPLLGKEWNDKKIKAGIALVKFLRINNIHNLFGIVTVDVTNVHREKYSRGSDIILWTENNTQIRWGCSSLFKPPEEPTDEEKLQNLLSIAKIEGTSLKQMEYVDVRWSKPVGKRWGN